MNTSYETPDEKAQFANMEASEDKGSFLKRNISPLKAVLYLVFFASGLCLFWGLLLWVFYQTLDNYTPKLQQGGGAFIGSNPGLGYRPRLDKTDPYSSLIW